MIFCFLHGIDPGSQKPELCLVSSSPSEFSTPVLVKNLRVTDSAVHCLSIEEGFTVDTDSEDNGLVITPVPPAILYLTPNRPEKPGYKVNKVKVVERGGGYQQVFFDRDRGWQQWQPNIRIY